MIKLVASDMDGTFLDGSGQFDRARFERILDGLEARGIRFAVASGRPYLALAALFEGFEKRVIFIAENGSLVVEKDQVYFEALMPPSLYLAIVASLERNPFARQGQWLLSGKRAAYVLESAPQEYVAHIAHYYEKVTRVRDFAAIEDDIFKITAQFDEELVQQAAQWLNQDVPGVTALVTGFDAIDIVRSDVDKQTGLEKLCQDLVLYPADLLVFGDNLNDYRMMEYAGTAIATANARQEIKQLADLVIGPCDQEAVQAYLEEFLWQQ